MNRKVDDEIYQREIVGKVEINEPVFILGHWRSGTTFLHNILSQDQQFTYATIYQTSNPLTFLKKEDQAYKRWENVRVKRPMDNINFVPPSPGEDGVRRISVESMFAFNKLVFSKTG